MSKKLQKIMRFRLPDNSEKVFVIKNIYLIEKCAGPSVVGTFDYTVYFKGTNMNTSLSFDSQEARDKNFNKLIKLLQN